MAYAVIEVKEASYQLIPKLEGKDEMPFDFIWKKVIAGKLSSFIKNKNFAEILICYIYGVSETLTKF